jgi:hypothetical protein
VGNKQEQILAFRTLLKAMYNQAIVISSADHLKICTQMADYYRCIPCLSVSLDGSLLSSPGLTSSLPRDCCELLTVATKLKNKLLFKECLIHVVGPWSSPRSQSLEDPLLIQIAQATREEILLKIGEFQIELLNVMASLTPQTMNLYASRTFNPASNAKDNDTKKVILPQYYRAIYNASTIGELPYSLVPHLSGLMANNLSFDKTGFLSGQVKGIYVASFLCADIRDEELPWSTEEFDEQ